MTIAEKKLSLLERLMKLPYYHTWERLENIVSEMEAEVTKAETPEALLAKFAKPRKRNIDIVALIEAQSYQGYNSERADKLVAAMDIQEPMEDLLKMI
jgi:hypothetical protein